MNRINPRPRINIDVVGASEEADEAVRILLPDFEGEIEGMGVDGDVVVGDEDGACGEGEREEAEVEGGGRVAEERDGDFGMGGEREVVEE